MQALLSRYPEECQPDTRVSSHPRASSKVLSCTPGSPEVVEGETCPQPPLCLVDSTRGRKPDQGFKRGIHMGPSAQLAQAAGCRAGGSRGRKACKGKGRTVNERRRFHRLTEQLRLAGPSGPTCPFPSRDTQRRMSRVKSRWLWEITMGQRCGKEASSLLGCIRQSITIMPRKEIPPLCSALVRLLWSAGFPSARKTWRYCNKSRHRDGGLERVV